MSLRDIGLFVKSARTDGAIARRRAALGSRAAFDAAYAGAADPWGSASARYTYQRHKYDSIMRQLPARPFRAALDLGCGLGLLSQRLAGRCDSTLGLDLSDQAVAQARIRGAGVPGLRFAQGDVTDLPRSLDRGFDLVMVADTLYYLSPLDDPMLKALALRLADLLVPGGVCVLADHFFSGADADSRRTRRVHQAFAWSPRFSVLAQHRRPFFLTTLLEVA